MIKLYKNIFYKPKYGNDADTVMMKKLFSTVTVVLVCLAAISFSAYAFFSYSVTSGANTIQSSSFSASVKIEKDKTLVTQGDIQSYRFESGAYTVTVTADSGTTGTGFCIIRIGDIEYYTQQLGVDLNAPNGERDEIRFILDIQVPTTVEIESRWGTTSYYDSVAESEFYIKNTDPLQVIAVNATQGVADNPEETTPKETLPEESKPEETTSPTELEETTSPAEPEEVVHIVVEGEILSEIAAQYGMSHTRVAAYNGILPPYEIYPGDEIRIPPADWVMPEVAE